MPGWRTAANTYAIVHHFRGATGALVSTAGAAHMAPDQPMTLYANARGFLVAERIFIPFNPEAENQKFRTGALEEAVAVDSGAEISWAEFEVPTVSSQAEISWAEVEFPNVNSMGHVSWAEFEVPNPNAMAQISWAELEVPNVNSQAEIAWAEFEVPTPNSLAHISWAELEVPDVGAPAGGRMMANKNPVGGRR